MIARIRPPRRRRERRRFGSKDAESRAHVLRRYGREGDGCEGTGKEGAEGVGFLVGDDGGVRGAGEVVR